MNKKAILILKMVAMLVVAAILAWQFYKAWHALAAMPKLVIDWRWGGIAILGFSASMLTSAIVWRLLAWNMGNRSPTLPLLAAYTFSQMGKYIPGKVGLLLMRIERAGRFGMSAQTCTLSTLLENALYMISGALVGLLAIVRIVAILDPGKRLLVWIATVAAILFLGAACLPPVFYGLVNRLLKKMKKPDVPRSEWLRAPVLLLAVAGFIPCWLFGGVALWASTCAVHPIDLADAWWFAGAYALSVIFGMVSLLPGGAGIREALSLAAVTIQLTPVLGHDQAFLLAGVGAILQRLFQIIVEIVLGLTGALITTTGTPQSPARVSTNPPSPSPQ